MENDYRSMPKTFEIFLIHLNVKQLPVKFQMANKEILLKRERSSYRCEVITENVIIKKTDGASEKVKGLRLHCMIIPVRRNNFFQSHFGDCLFREFIMHHHVTGWH